MVVNTSQDKVTGYLLFCKPHLGEVNRVIANAYGKQVMNEIMERKRGELYPDSYIYRI